MSSSVLSDFWFSRWYPPIERAVKSLDFNFKMRDRRIDELEKCIDSIEQMLGKEEK